MLSRHSQRQIWEPRDNGTPKSRILVSSNSTSDVFDNSTRAWHENVLLLFVLIGELFSQGFLLFDGPLVHLRPCDDIEDQGCETFADQGNASPGDQFEEVVGACDEIKAIAFGNSSLCSARRAQIAERKMCLEVGNLAEEIQDDTCNIHVIDNWTR